MNDLNFMMEVEEVFKLAFNQTMASRSENEKVACLIFLDDLINNRKPFSLVNEEGIVETTASIFNDPVASDLVEDLKFQFFGRWGYQSQKMTELCSRLAMGVCQDFNTDISDNDLISSPPEYQARYPDYKETIAYLSLNKWVICLLLTQLVVVLDPKELRNAKQIMAEPNGTTSS